MPKPPKCLACGANHWSTQPCKGEKPTKAADVAKVADVQLAADLPASDPKDTQFTPLERLGFIEETVFEHESRLDALETHKQKARERVKRHRERQKQREDGQS